MNNSYSATTQTGTLGRRLSNHSVFWKQDSFFFFFANRLIKFNYAAVENFKTVWSYLTSQETALKFMNVIFHLQKNLRFFCFQQTLCVYNLIPNAMVRVATMYGVRHQDTSLMIMIYQINIQKNLELLFDLFSPFIYFKYTSFSLLF